MPWKEVHVLDERLKFINLCLEKKHPLAEICREFGISRPTAYKFLQRYNDEGPAGLHDKPRAPHAHPNSVSPDIEEQILKAKTAYPTWGPRKLRAWLQKKYQACCWPAPSTIGEILKRNGLTRKSRLRRKASPSSALTRPDGPNSVWTVDFKGWFRTKDGKKCHPLTIIDAHSRYIIRCQALSREDTDSAMPVFVGAFLEFGLPAVIRSDNGPPFASVAAGGFSRLSLWFLKMGIVPERIKPGHPEENGSHENMHRFLKADIIVNSPSENLHGQQRNFDRFVREYNEERPHEALGYKTPSELYVPSSYRFPLAAPKFTYSKEYTLRSVHKDGSIRWKRKDIYISEVFRRETVGLLPIHDCYWKVYMGPVVVGVLDEGVKKFLSGKDADKILRDFEEEHRK